MKKLFFVVLFLIFAAIPALSEQDVRITGVSDGDLLPGEIYTDISLTINGASVPAEWTVSDASAARINSTKKLFTKAVKAPVTFVLTGTSTKTGASASVTLTCVPNAKSISIRANDRAQKELELLLSESSNTLPLTAVVSPAWANAYLTWTSSDENIATVDENGVVTGRLAGKTQITVTSVNGVKAVQTIVVSHAAESVEIEGPAELSVGANAQLSAIIQPEIAAGCAVTWESSNAKIVSVDKTGKIRGVSAGKAYIRATAAGGASAIIEVEAYLPVQSLSFKSGMQLSVGETRRAEVIVRPTNAKYSAVTFRSESPAVASVDEQGNITGLSQGVARITATAPNGVSTRMDVTVKYIEIKSIAHDVRFINLAPGQTYDFSIQYSPANTSNRKILFSSDNPDAVTVDENGNVTAVAAGRAVLCASVENGACKPFKLNVRVKDDSSLPLAGVIIGINPGHQIKRDYTQLPVAPGSKTTKNANNGYAIGVKTRNPEYQVTLDISLYLRDALEKLGATVVMTRTENDVTINNIERALMLNEANVDVALQIHCDNNSDASKRGISMFTKSNDRESAEIAALLMSAACQYTGANSRGCKISDTYMSLNYSETASVLVECGYMSNAKEDVLLGTPEYQMLLAEGLANGILQYFDK